MNKKISIGAAIMLMAMTAAVTITITVVVVMRVVNENITGLTRRQSMFAKLAAVDEWVRDYYIGTIDEAKLNDSLIKGYMSGIGDKYGTYLNADAYKSIMEENKGQATGIGVNVVENSKGYIQVVSVLEGSPAEAADVRANDIITEIAGQDVSLMGYKTAINALHGSVGTTAEFTVLRGGVEIKKSVERKTFETKTVVSRMIGDIGYMRIVAFDGKTAEQFSEQVDSLIKKGAKGLIFDVRNNPGGLLDNVEKMIDKLVPEGPIVRAQYKDGNIKTLATSDANEVKLLMAVITNQNTASAAELFTAALKDYGKAKSIGTKTYGKGTMQQIIDLHDGTALDLSVAKFYPPRSDNFEGKGVLPDIPVTLSDEKQARFYTLADKEDDQLQAALEYLKPLIQ